MNRAPPGLAFSGISRIPVIDLHSTAAARLAELQLPKNVHFTALGYEVLGQRVATAILPLLK
ncbi:MAG: hypothetical protein QNL01_06575 [Akkermansiaceae bacterium]